MRQFGVGGRWCSASLSLSHTLSRRGGYEKAVLLDDTLKISSGARAKTKREKNASSTHQKKLTLFGVLKTERSTVKERERESIKLEKSSHRHISKWVKT